MRQNCYAVRTLLNLLKVDMYTNFNKNAQHFSVY